MRFVPAALLLALASTAAAEPEAALPAPKKLWAAPHAERFASGPWVRTDGERVVVVFPGAEVTVRDVGSGKVLKNLKLPLESCPAPSADLRIQEGVLLTGPGTAALCGFDLGSGKLLWKRDFGGHVVEADELYFLGGVFVWAPRSGTALSALDLRSGHDLWQKRLQKDEGIGDYAAAAGDRILLTHERSVDALEARTGRTLWSFTIPEGVTKDRLKVGPRYVKVGEQPVTDKPELTRLIFLSLQTGKPLPPLEVADLQQLYVGDAGVLVVTTDNDVRLYPGADRPAAKAVEIGRAESTVEFARGVPSFVVVRQTDGALLGFPLKDRKKNWTYSTDPDARLYLVGRKSGSAVVVVNTSEETVGLDAEALEAKAAAGK